MDSSEHFLRNAKIFVFLNIYLSLNFICIYKFKLRNCQDEISNLRNKNTEKFYEIFSSSTMIIHFRK
jgi:hypothetical protein